MESASTSKRLTFQVVIERAPGGDGYTAYSPTLAGCFQRAATIEEAKERIREALRVRVEDLLAGGQPISQSENLIHVEEISIPVPEARPRDRRSRRR